ncbi:hypothetical protein M5K25_006530 [Dendrobium thyrsiflorum]|uniref:Uncharacterized protein n=1 Tax=Dendrobium thyrsiflorum TaxID=117978 RepID=A0ABD0VBU0_DENTH
MCFHAMKSSPKFPEILNPAELPLFTLDENVQHSLEQFPSFNLTNHILQNIIPSISSDHYLGDDG